MAQRSPFALKSPIVHHECRGRSVLVFDDVLPVRLVAALGQFMLRLKYARRTSFDNELSADVDNELFERLPGLPDATAELLKRHYAKASAVRNRQVLSHVYGASMRYGDQTQIHRDIDCPDCMTFLYYGNSYWDPSWGGETIFFDDNQSAMFAVTPKPGRLVLFNAQLFHRTGIPMRDCPSHRYAMSVFMRCKPQIEASKRYFADASKKARALDATSSKS